jgi:hypothetical protein
MGGIAIRKKANSGVNGWGRLTNEPGALRGKMHGDYLEKKKYVVE